MVIASNAMCSYLHTCIALQSLPTILPTLDPPNNHDCMHLYTCIGPLSTLIEDFLDGVLLAALWLYNLQFVLSFQIQVNQTQCRLPRSTTVHVHVDHLSL